jgi:GNAT superfamily N-acetyltransferase
MSLVFSPGRTGAKMSAMKETARFTIRPAAPSDAAAIFSLTTALAEYEKLPPPEAASATRLQQDMQRQPARFQAWLAEADGRPVGYALAFETYTTFLAAPKYYLEDIFVLPEYRGRGIGHAFFRTLAGEAVRRGCIMMEWTALR